MKNLIFLLVIIFFIANQDAYSQFGPESTTFDLTVPANFNHETQIDASMKKAKNERTVDRVESCLTSANFAKQTAKLVPGGSYVVKIFPIIETVTSEQCLDFLKRQNAIPVGLHGLTVIFDLKKDRLPKDKWIISFAPKEELFVDKDGNHVVPYLHTFEIGDYSYEIESFESKYCWIAPNRSIVCVTKKL